MYSSSYLYSNNNKNGKNNVSKLAKEKEKSRFQNEAKCETFVAKMSCICIIIKNHFHINGFALSLALKLRFFGTRKWPIQLAKNILTTDF